MVRRYFLIVLMLLMLHPAMAVWVKTEFDYKGATAAEAAYLAVQKAENLNLQSIEEILKHYTSAEIASAGIHAAKFLERKALKDVRIFGTEENHYYKVILWIVSKRIIPRTLRIGKECLNHPDKFLYWGPYLFRVCQDTQNLCIQFETVVCNGKKSFSGVKFLSLNTDLKQYFDLSKLGNVNWDELWNNITNIPKPSWEDFREDFKSLFDKVSPINLAIAGEESIRGRATGIFDKFAEAPSSIPDFFDKLDEAFHDVTSGAAITSVLEGVIGDLKDSLAVERLFNLSDYNIGSYISDYANQLYGQYYTQKWYIYHYNGSGGGGIQPTSWYTQKYNIVLSIKIHYGLTDGTENRILYSETYDSRSNNLANFEMAFTRKLQNYERDYGQGGVVSVEVEPQETHTIGGGGGSGSGGKIIDYEDLFDSRRHNEMVWDKEFERRRLTLEKDQEVVFPKLPIKYYIGKGDKNYYQLASAETVREASTASFTVSCADVLELAKGGFNFKVNERYNSSRMNEYAYPSGMVAEKKPEDTSHLTSKMDGFQQKIDDNYDDIKDYNIEISRLQAIADTTTNAYDKRNLEIQKSNYSMLVDRLQAEIRALQDSINTYQNVLDEMEIDYNEDLDGPYRIPTLENDLARDFRISWDGAGTWSGHTYTRLGHIVGMENGIKFVAEVKEERGEKRFLGIRYHRAIVGVEWKLVSEYETSDVVDVLKLEDDLSDQEKADMVNRRRSEIQSDYPGCHVDIQYTMKDPPDKDDEEAPFHLLWMSDRVALARFIEYRLRQIDGELAFIERSLLAQKSVLEDFKRAFMAGVPRWRTSTGYGRSLQRWLDSGTGNVVQRAQDWQEGQ